MSPHEAPKNIQTAMHYANNGGLILNAHRLGYIADEALTVDLTYGNGVWWKYYRPKRLIRNNMQKLDGKYHHNVLELPESWNERFDVVCLDPPFKLNGTPTPEVDARYGVEIPASWQERMALIDQMVYAAMLCVKPDGGYLIIKCMNQVSRHHKRWQTYFIYETVEGLEKNPFHLHDELLMLRAPRWQDPNRPQRHSHANFSTMMVFRRGGCKDA